MKKKLIVLSGFILGSAPFVALAQVTGRPPYRCANQPVTDVQSFMCKINEILGAALPLLIALGVLFFVWGVVTYMIGGDEEAKKKGREKIIYGLIGLAVIIGLWGLVKILTTTFGVTNQQPIEFPTTPY